MNVHVHVPQVTSSHHNYSFYLNHITYNKLLILNDIFS